MPTSREIKAVRRVLYAKERERKMLDEARSIVVLMNFNPRGNIDQEDIRVTAGAGPLWFIPATGEVDPGVLEAADRSKRIAAMLRDTRRELKDVDFDADDKRNLRDALEQQAQALIKRAKAWTAPTVGDPEAIAADIHRHDAAAANSYSKVFAYLDENAFEGLS
jgi:hypothetical protein